VQTRLRRKGLFKEKCFEFRVKRCEEWSSML